jgi:hypothetical protein
VTTGIDPRQRATPPGASSLLAQIRAEAGRRWRQTRRLLEAEGLPGLTARLLARLVRRLPTNRWQLEVKTADLLAADIGKPRPGVPLVWNGQEPLVSNWIVVPPGPGSGGHTTLLRLLSYLERHGHTCRLYLYDIHGGDAQYYEAAIRRLFPAFRGAVLDVAGGMADAHAVFATSWQTAYPVFNDSCLGQRFYFVQDFEPFFYPVGTSSVLAENTYRMGFRAITAGRWLAEKLANDYRMVSDAFEFGCDTARYFLQDDVPRTGIVFYARPEAPRRAFELGMLALEIFATRHPEIKIHFYGNKIRRAPFPIIDHGLVAPAELNDIYNRCYAGLSLSMTNVSLVPHEMLAAGCIPVVNDAEHNQIVLDNPYVRYAPAAPIALADALSQLVELDDFTKLATEAASSVQAVSWDDAGATIDRVLRSAVAATSRP